MKTLEVGNATTLSAPDVKLGRILFATDFSSYSNAALPYAIAIARQYGAKLYGAHVVSTDAYMFATPETWPALLEYQEAQEHIACARLEESLRGTPHQVVSAVGDIADVIFRLVHENDIDLIVLGTHGRTGLPKLVIGSVAEKVFRQASCPVLTVGPHVRNAQQSMPEFRRVLFATDFSDESVAALPHAISLAQQRSAHLSLLHVLEHPHAGTVDYESNADFIIRQLESLVPMESGLWFESSYIVEFGSAEEQIVKFAFAHAADVIVLGVRGAQGPSATVKHLAHSKAQHIVAHATCPVLTVRG
jgi:nucleotide-binding universal stress UspA family protein